MKKLYLLIWVENNAICTQTYPTKEDAELHSTKLSEGTLRLIKEINECQLYTAFQRINTTAAVSLMD